MLLRDLAEKREMMKEGLAEGEADGAEAYNKTVGRCSELKDVIEYILRDFDYIDEDQDKND